MTHLAEAGQGYHVDVNQVTRRLQLVPLHWRLGLQVPQSTQTQTAEGPGDGGEGSPQEPGNMPEVQPLMTKIHGLLQLLRIERPLLGTAHAASISQRGWPP
ncbi:hypothetical protein [Vulcanococcus limneticus]|uniref:hypothetical protein n=1 Tax=Vulcanococcus limneticus TaxID=2170428 RepID=UPI00398BE9C9